MNSIEPGIYHIINRLSGKAITIPEDNLGTITGCSFNSPNQKWFVRRSANYYQFEDCLYGRFIAPDNTNRGTRVNLGRYPINWEILPFGVNEYLIKLVGYDLVLDQHADTEIHCWPRDGDKPQKRWKFERLSDFTGDAPENGSGSAMPTKDGLVARLTERLEQKDDQLAILNRVIHEQRLEIERGTKELARTREELSILNARLAGRKECSGASSNALSSNPSQNEIADLREKLDRLAFLMSKLGASWLAVQRPSEYDKMANVEPGTYRIINLARNKALRVPNEHPDTIASWHPQDEPNQKWLVQRVGGGYRFKNCGHGRYLSVHGTQCNSRAYHGSPTTWKIIPQTPGGYLIQLEAIDRVLDLHDRGEVYIWPANDAEPQKVWKFERLGREAGEAGREAKDESTSGQAGDAPVTDEAVSKDEGMTEKAPPPLSPLAIRDVQIAQQARQIESLQKQLSEKDQDMEKLREELGLVGSQESSQVTVLSEKIAQLEELVERMCEAIRTGVEKTQ